MSNKIVPSIYRTIIDEVITNIKSDFDEYGVSEDVLAELQSKWQAKVIASRVAEFEPQPPPPQAPAPQQQYPPHPTHPHTPLHYQSSTPHYSSPFLTQPPHPSHVKSEPADPRALLYPNYSLPPPPRPPPGYTTPQTQSQPQPRPVATTAVPVSRPLNAMTNGGGSTPGTRIPQVDGASGRIPQLDGSSSSGSSASPPPSQQYAPHSSHPSLPQPAVKSAEADDEAINSDLDDPDSDDSEDVEEGVGETDMMFCTYDKVARVKNKWKCVLKDGMVHINGRDYLFSKCSGEFEW
ncbi:transcription factor IIA, alpha/beta subunit [Vararia minispora EC-137]|uniref:Transcription factor IIA, alpha/beta subunit n=1 Tax=Vararia minispora EC-137 TaxID=1314806 RepID=A0ACB8QD25_9AGAM|nr:transcription factor IIA, alpha/beta subunit [Vararia minispora EC-137]